MQNQELSLKTSQGNATKRTTERSNPSAVDYINAFSNAAKSIGGLLTGVGDIKTPKPKTNNGSGSDVTNKVH